MISNPTHKFKKHFFLDLTKSSQSGQHLAGTGPEPDLKNYRIDRNRNQIFGRTLWLLLHARVQVTESCIQMLAEKMIHNMIIIYAIEFIHFCVTKLTSRKTIWIF